jgi:type II secretory pathway component GspD/PulD (secretin)
VRKMFRMMLGAMVLLATAGLAAQEAIGPTTVQNQTRPAGQLVPLKVSLVLLRYQGEKKISSAPYVLWVTANNPERTSLRMGNQIPITTTVFPGNAGERSQTSYTYKDVGTNIDCTSSTAADGYFRLNVTISDSSVYFPDRTDPTLSTSAASATGAAAFRSFTASFYILVRDGQTVQYTSATDQLNGQVLKIDATVNVQK